jgi:hypothetical protein
MRKCEFLVPTFSRGSDEPLLERRTGYRVHLEILGQPGVKRPFVLQCEPGDTRPCILADWASGYRLTDLGPLMLEKFVRHPSAYREAIRDWRWQAQLWLDAVIQRQGADKVLMKMNAVPRVNE